MRPRDAAPYKFLSPYEVTDKAVFFGREGDRARLVGEVLSRPLVVLSGLPGVGKTSLVNAGLIPELLARDTLVLTVREYGTGDPTKVLRETISASGAGCRVRRRSGAPRPIAFGDAAYRPKAGCSLRRLREVPARRRTGGTRGFSRQLAACVATLDRTRYCLVLVVRNDVVGSLPGWLPDLPDILHGLVPLEAFTPEQARQALEGPLWRHNPPMHFDPDFLRGTLLPDLCAGEEKDQPDLSADRGLQAVQRGHASRRTDDRARPISGGRLQGDPGPLPERNAAWAPDGQRDLARTLLKAMASPAGERVFVGASQLARPAGAELSAVQAVLDALLKAGLLEPRPMPDGAVAYSLGHQVLAAVVKGWTDPEKARDRCAEATLKRDWEAWYEEWYVTRRQGPTAADVIGLLVPADHLREIRARRPGVTVGAPQLCLLLQSAVRHRCDMAYWARELAGSKAALDLLEQIHDGPAAEAPRDALQAVELGAEALGIGQAYIGRQGLARAAVAYGRSTRGDGAVRHTAALALAALAEEVPGPAALIGKAPALNAVAEKAPAPAALAGKTLRLDTVDEALATLHEAAP